MADYELTSVASGAELDTAIGLAETALQPVDIGVGGGVQGYDADTIIGDGSILSVIALTQAEYDALTPSATTLYIITDA
jgi:hypothetical protein